MEKWKALLQAEKAMTIADRNPCKTLFLHSPEAARETILHSG